MNVMNMNIIDMDIIIILLLFILYLLLKNKTKETFEPINMDDQSVKVVTEKSGIVKVKDYGVYFVSICGDKLNYDIDITFFLNYYKNGVSINMISPSDPGYEINVSPYFTNGAAGAVIGGNIEHNYFCNARIVKFI